MKKFIFLSLVLFAFAAINADESYEIDGRILKPFLDNYCVKCHGAEKQKGDVRLDNIFAEGAKLDLNSEDTVFHLSDILDQLHLGEMPPKKAEHQPSSEALKQITSFLSTSLLELEKSRRTSGTVMRRLTIQEYKNTVRDLLDIDTEYLDFTTGFPADDNDHGFVNIGESQIMSEAHLDSYLDAAQKYLQRAFQFGPQRTSEIRTIKPSDWGLDAKTNGDWVFRFNNQDKYIDIGSGQRDLSTHNSLASVPKKLLVQRNNLKAGYYKIRISAGAVNRLTHPYDASMIPCDLSVPMQLGLYISDSFMGMTPSGGSNRNLLAVYDLKDNNEEEYECTVWLDKGEFPFVNWHNGPGVSDKWMRYVVAKYHDDITYSAKEGAHRYTITGKNAIPGRMVSESWKGPVIRIHNLELEGPLDDLPIANDLYMQGERVAISLHKVINAFAEKAYRRPIKAGEMQAYIKMAQELVISKKKSKRQALLMALQAVMVSRDFLFIPERNEFGIQLSSYEIASRLSYALWGSMPDKALMDLAKNDFLQERKIVRTQVERMLSDPKAAYLTKSFTDSWLHLSKLGEMPPDKRKFHNYYRDNLEAFMQEETRRFFDYILYNNRPITDFIDADYSFVNKQLAELYGLEGVVSPRFSKITWPAGTPRGGLLGQASVLTVSANGVETSPVIRGAWILENILGTPPAPPPPDVEALEPDIRGAKTLKERLSKHRDVETCADCHSKIDPYGFPLEFYDPIGEFRPNYNRSFWDVRKNIKIKRKGIKVDGSSELASSEKFHDLASLKQVLMKRKDLFARNLASKLLKHGVGRHLTVTDKDEITKILAKSQQGNYLFKDLLIDVISSQAFISK
ncbi:DUF1592 domain-containing protein [Lentisphaera profundi]|uniref:DUF1592 domain-containing protein n=1 Tax=Lentisphaera profundi TaxID=1658616 RepID=A0ABY7VQQ6_9BACT|nr:DUF1592 domain-containing protein [Lentisphaera profundi]WDE96525.1 DUF1592 domain-containing protein [Lentisphaera profundi]